MSKKGEYNGVCASPDCDKTGAIWGSGDRGCDFYCHTCAVRTNNDMHRAGNPVKYRQMVGSINVNSFDHLVKRRLMAPGRHVTQLAISISWTPQ